MPARQSTGRFHSASRRSKGSLAVAAAALCGSSPTSASLVAAYNGNARSGYSSVAPWGPTSEQSLRQQRTQYANSYGDNARGAYSGAFPPDRMRDRGGQLANYYESPNHNCNRAVNDASFGDNAAAAAAAARYGHPPAQRLIQGGSRRQYAAHGTRSDVRLSTDGGRPLDARVELWDGPDNTSHNVRVWSEDGSGRPMDVAMERADHYQRWGGVYGGHRRNGSLDVRNRGPMEYPIRAGVGHRPPPRRRRQQPQQQQLYAPPSSSTYAGGGRRTMTTTATETMIQGGTVRHFPVDPTASSVRVTLASGGGLPIKALVELLQGPGRVAQLAEVSNQHGRPFGATFPTPGYGSTLAVRNDGPLEYPFYATVEPVSMEGGGSGGGMGMGGSGMGMGRENRYGDYGSEGTYGGGGYNGGYGYNNNGGGGGGTTGSYGGGYQYN